METNLLGWNSVQRSWFLRDNEAGLHSFVRLAYHNPSDTVGRGGLGEVRAVVCVLVLAERVVHWNLDSG